VVHAPAVINDETHTQRNVFMFEERNFLGHTVLKYLEIVFSESIDWASILVQHRNRQLHKLDIDTDGEVFVLISCILSERRTYKHKKNDCCTDTQSGFQYPPCIFVAAFFDRPYSYRVYLRIRRQVR